MLREDMASLGPVKMKDVEEAHKAPSPSWPRNSRRLGEIEISPSSDDKVMSNRTAPANRAMPS